MLQTVKFHRTQSYISDKCVTFFFFSIQSPFMALITYAQSAPKWPAGYKWTLYASYTLHDYVRELGRRKSTMFWHLHSKLLYIHSRRDEKMIIFQVGCNTAKKSIYIAQFQHIYPYVYIYLKLHFIQHVDGCASTQLNPWTYVLPDNVWRSHFHPATCAASTLFTS